MSVTTARSDSEEPITPAGLVAYFAEGAKPRPDWRVGAEFEKLALDRAAAGHLAFDRVEGILLGLAARFVTGYLYDPMTDIKTGMRGAGSTHAWVQIFLPGAGWIEFDPTNGLIASGNLIRTGVGRTPAQAVPLEGSFKGASADFIGMEVDVDVTALAPTLYG